MSTTHTPDFGEPWKKRESWFAYPFESRHGEIHENFVDRALTCVNALAGISDPAASLQKVREALEESIQWSKLLANDDNYIEPDFDPCEYASKMRDALKQALALLTPNK